jgi:4-amino-4-deoxy-L-arabinose transferase-like glycosyltransferase
LKDIAPTQKAKWAIIIFIFVVAITIRICIAWPALSGQRTFKGDESNYYELAISTIKSERLLLNGAPSAYRMPLFPLFLAPIYIIFGNSTFTPIPIILFLNSLICVEVYFLGKQLFNPNIGIWAGFISAIDIQIFIFSGYLLTETLSTFLFLSGMLALEQLRKLETRRLAVITGIIFGLAFLTRANLIVFAPFMLAWLIYQGQKDIRRILVNGLIIAGAILILWLSWIGRNMFEMGAFIPFTTQGGSTYLGLYNDQVANMSNLYQYGQWKNLIMPDAYKLSEIEVDKKARDMAFTWISAHPLQAMGVMLMQIVHFWRYSGVYLRYYSIIFWMVLMLASGYGLWLARAQIKEGLGIWVILAIVLTVVAAITVGDPRYRIGLQPILDVLTAVTVNAVILKFGLRK